MSNSDLPIWAVVAASGTGQRMSAGLPKQYLQFSGKTIIEHTLDRLTDFSNLSGIILVINAKDKHWSELKYQSHKPLITTIGGEQRQQSVYQGLLKLKESIADDCIVLVHDAVRPLITHQDLENVVRVAKVNEAGAVLASPVADSLKQQDGAGNIKSTVSRQGLWRALTPQAFRLSLLLRALSHVIDNRLDITDDAAAVEALGLKPKLVKGNANNIKITLPEDLALAEHIYQSQQQLNHRNQE